MEGYFPELCEDCQLHIGRIKLDNNKRSFQTQESDQRSGSRTTGPEFGRIMGSMPGTISFGDLLPVALLTEPTGCLIKR